jgi:hypothetical protein
MPGFYTYLWLREDGSPYYVGKGKGMRGFTSRDHNVKCPKNSDLIIVQDWLSEEQAFEAEKFFIAYYGRIVDGTGCLRNITEGGTGGGTMTGHTHTMETRQKMSTAAISRHAGSRLSFAGRTHSLETKTKMSEKASARINRFVSEETRQKMSTALRGRTYPERQYSEETRNKLKAAALKGWALRRQNHA